MRARGPKRRRRWRQNRHARSRPNRRPNDRRGDRHGDRGQTTVHSLIVADGDLASRAALDAGWPGWEPRGRLVVARTAAGQGRDTRSCAGAAVGDADSLPEVRFAEVPRGRRDRAIPARQGRVDAELALLAALQRGATHVTILGLWAGSASTTPWRTWPARAAGARRCRGRAARRDHAGQAAAGSGVDGRQPAATSPRREDLVSLLALGEPAVRVTTAGSSIPS